MKIFYILPASLFTLILTLFGITSAIADSKIEAFAQKYAEALTKGDAAILQAMTYTEGASPDDLKKLKETTEISLRYRPTTPISSVTVEALPKDYLDAYSSPNIYNGEKVEPNLKPEGMIKLSYEGGGDHAIPYVIRNGTPWLVGLKVTKLNWIGPLEERYFLGASNNSDRGIKIKVESVYRGSGVEQSRTKNVFIEADSSAAIAVNANELISAKITTEEADVTLQASIYRFNEAERKKINLIEQEISKVKPLIFSGVKPTRKIEKSE